jgi:hypothetical protein
VGWSRLPAEIETCRPCEGAQNNCEPHWAQNPRRASGDDRYHFSFRDVSIDNASGAQAVKAPKCVSARWHMRQWQKTTSRNSPWIENRTAPHRQLPVARTLPPSIAALLDILVCTIILEL